LVSSEDILSNKMALADLIDYQEDSVVSRTIIEKNAGTVTLFAFDEGQGLSEHAAPYEALVYAISGEAEITLSSNRYHLVEGDILLLPASRPHTLKALRRFKMMLVMIRQT
jgi:quercetin dioxygenase-like cupin family protein